MPSSSFMKKKSEPFVFAKCLALAILLSACRNPILDNAKVNNATVSSTGCFDFAGQSIQTTYQRIENEARFGDDMRLPLGRIYDCGSGGQLNLATENRIAGSTTFLWRNNRIPYLLPSNFPFAADLEFAVAEWKKSGISWEPKTNVDTNYVNFVLLDASDPKIAGACGTSVLGKAGGKQDIQLRTQDTLETCGPVLRRTLLHEMGHAMGFMHEHQRPDRDDFIQFNFDISSYIWLEKISATSVLGPYDIESVMHYSTQQFLGMKTKSGASIPHNLFLSQKDIDGARKLYGTPTLTVNTSAYLMQEDVQKAFVISADTPDNSLACNETHWSYTSLHPEIVPATGAIRWSGNWSETQRSCTITITPKSNASGSATLALTLTDGAYSSTKNMTVLIAAINDPPTIASIQGQSTEEDTEKTIPLTVADVDNTLSCSSTHFNYSSSNPMIVSSTGAVSWSGTWPDCSATVTPRVNASGSSQLTFTLSDGTRTASASFSFSVAQINDTPVVSEVNQIQNANVNSTKLISFSIEDVDAPLSCGTDHLSYTSNNPSVVAASGAIQWSGNWPHCVAAITPAENASGDAELTLTVTDGALKSSRSFRLSVSNSNESQLFSNVVKERVLLAGSSLDLPLNLLPTLNTLVPTSSSASCATLFLTSTTAPEILSQEDFTMEGLFPNCTLRVNAKPQAHGSARLTLGLQAGKEILSQTMTMKIKLLSAVIQVSALKSKAPIWIEFNGSESQTQAASKITSWEWDFGDGTQGSSMNFSKIYTVPGEYEITLKVMDSSGKQDVEKVKITIED